MHIKQALMAMILSGFAWPAVAQITDDFRWIELTDQVSVIQLGPRLTNVGVVRGPGEGLVIDSYLASQAEGLVQQVVAKLGEVPDYLVTTHSHGDHWGANANFAALGTHLIAHRQTRDTMSGDSWSIIREQMMPPAPPSALANLVVDQQLHLMFGQGIELLHLPSAHTGGDLVVWIPQADVLFTGDILAVGYPTLLDAANQGSLDGLIEAQQQLLDMAGENTRVVPGHGPITDARALQYSVAFMRSLRDRLAQRSELPPAEETLLEGLLDLGQESDAQRSRILVRQAFQSLQ